jgi:hypothetical protein
MCRDAVRRRRYDRCQDGVKERNLIDEDEYNTRRKDILESILRNAVPLANVAYAQG